MAWSATSSRTAHCAARRAAIACALLALVALVLVPSTPAGADPAHLPATHGVKSPEPVTGRDGDMRQSAFVVHRTTPIDRSTVPLGLIPAAVVIGTMVLLGFAIRGHQHHLDARPPGPTRGRAPPRLAFTA